VPPVPKASFTLGTPKAKATLPAARKAGSAGGGGPPPVPRKSADPPAAAPAARKGGGKLGAPAGLAGLLGGKGPPQRPRAEKAAAGDGAEQAAGGLPPAEHVTAGRSKRTGRQRQTRRGGSPRAAAGGWAGRAAVYRLVKGSWARRGSGAARLSLSEAPAAELVAAAEGVELLRLRLRGGMAALSKPVGGAVFVTLQAPSAPGAAAVELDGFQLESAADADGLLSALRRGPGQPAAVRRP
jgi:hypothetical protein